MLAVGSSAVIAGQLDLIRLSNRFPFPASLTCSSRSSSLGTDSCRRCVTEGAACVSRVLSVLSSVVLAALCFLVVYPVLI